MSLSRREMREQAFILCYETLFNCISIEDAIEAAKESEDEFCPYAIACVTGIIENKDKIDNIISKYLKSGWKINRISMVSHAILLVAIYEIIYNDEIPDSVAINEAIELSKKFTVPDDSSFINGILGSYVREKENG